MNWSDFKDNPQDLIGKIVLRSYGSNTGGESQQITTIDSVKKETFTINADAHKPSADRNKYRLSNGTERVQRGLWSGLYNDCKLITEEEATQYRTKWKQNRERREMETRLKLTLSSTELTHEVLTALCAVLDEYKV